MFEGQSSMEFKPSSVERQKSESPFDYDSMFVLACNLQQLVVTANMGSIMGPTTYIIFFWILCYIVAYLLTLYPFPTLGGTQVKLNVGVAFTLVMLVVII